jgi:GNAT superfamily N-acetyltransferase
MHCAKLVGSTAIRPLERRDIPRVTRLLLSALRSDYITHLEIQYGISSNEFELTPQARSIIEEEFESALTGGEVRTWVAERGRKVLGFATVSLSSPIRPRSADFWDVVVDENHRREGLGAALIARVHRFVDEAGVSSVFADVNPRNRRSLKILRSNGYEQVSTVLLRRGGNRSSSQKVARRSARASRID